MDYRIGITGAQGSGKTTLARYIDAHYGIPYVDAGVGKLLAANDAQGNRYILCDLRTAGGGNDDLVAIFGVVIGGRGVGRRVGVLGKGVGRGGRGAQHGGAQQDVAQSHDVSLSPNRRTQPKGLSGRCPAATCRCSDRNRRVNARMRKLANFRGFVTE